MSEMTPITREESLKAEGEARCKHCAEPIWRCGRLPSHGGCSSASGWIHAIGWRHSCGGSSSGNYALPDEGAATTSTTPRIRWEPTEFGGWTGYVGTVKAPLFSLRRRRIAWVLTAAIPGTSYRIIRDDAKHPLPPVTELKEQAERWLEEFVASLGAVFPGEGQDAIVRWQDVRKGDLVLLDDELTTAEDVQVCQKPWGDETTFTAADISHRLDNGVLVTSERHGDRYTAVRRAVPDETAVKAGEE